MDTLESIETKLDLYVANYTNQQQMKLIAGKFYSLGKVLDEVSLEVSKLYEETFSAVYEAVSNCLSCDTLTLVDLINPVIISPFVCEPASMELPPLLYFGCNKGKLLIYGTLDYAEDLDLAHLKAFAKRTLDEMNYSLWLPKIIKDDRLWYFIYYSLMMGAGLSVGEAIKARHSAIQEIMSILKLN